MGIYINPKDMSKEEWLAKHGEPMLNPQFSPPETGCYTICLVDNRMFTAAGVCVDEREFEAFQYPDGRPRKWYRAPRALVDAVST